MIRMIQKIARASLSDAAAWMALAKVPQNRAPARDHGD